MPRGWAKTKAPERGTSGRYSLTARPWHHGVQVCHHLPPKLVFFECRVLRRSGLRIEGARFFVTNAYVSRIAESGLSIYDTIEVGDPDLWVPTRELEEILDAKLVGISLAGLALRTRSKVVKENVCRALGYPVPSSFKKTQPRFVGQLFDTYAQKSNNLQVCNEELSATRRYVIIRVSEADTITRVKVVNGEDLAQLDTTGTLTQKPRLNFQVQHLRPAGHRMLR